MSYRTATSESSEDVASFSENSFCVFLHIGEGVGLQRSRAAADSQYDQITMHASLNTVKFEIEGHPTEAATIFNSNCIWECSLSALKRMKTENRPVRIACFLKNGVTGGPPLKQIGTLLLPIRGIPTVTTLTNYQPKMLWHKMSGLCSEWRANKPEIYLLIVVAKKSLIDDNSFFALLGKKSLHVRSPRSSETADMLHSQRNVYVQLLEHLGLIQVGNNPDVDCDIFLVTLTLRRLKDMAKLLDVESSPHGPNTFVFQYELFGSETHDELTIDSSDCYVLNQKIGLKFKASLHSLRLYFQRIFFVPIVIYYNGHAIASYRFDCSKFLPDMGYFNSNQHWNKNSSFYFDRLHKILSPRAAKPSVEFTLSLQLLERYSRKCARETVPLLETFVPYNVDEGASGDCHSSQPTVYSSNSKCSQLSDVMQSRGGSDPMMIFTPRAENFINEECQLPMSVETFDACTDTADLPFGTTEEIEHNDVSVDTEKLVDLRTTAVNTDATKPNDGEILTIRMIKELEAWKAQQMREFCEKLERKEAVYLEKLRSESQLENCLLEENVKLKTAECLELKKQLNHLEAQLEACKHEDFEEVKLEAEHSFVKRIQHLEYEIQNWKLELQKQKQLYATEKQSFDMLQQEKLRIQHENLVLKKNVTHLEQKLFSLGQTHFSPDELKSMMSDLRRQTERFSDIEKQKNFYKDKLIKATRDLQQMKLNVLKHKEVTLLKSSSENSHGLEDHSLSGSDLSQDDKLDGRIGFPITIKGFEPKHESQLIKERILNHTDSTSYDSESLES